VLTRSPIPCNQESPRHIRHFPPRNTPDENAIALSNELIDDRRPSSGAFGVAVWMCSQQPRKVMRC
jgi:hypothetical protein